MPLTATRRDFLAKLGVHPRAHVAGSSHQRADRWSDWSLSAGFEDYLGLESEVISAFRRLKSLEVHPRRCHELEVAVKATQGLVTAARDREAASYALEQGCKTLGDIKHRLVQLIGEAEVQGAQSPGAAQLADLHSAYASRLYDEIGPALAELDEEEHDSDPDDRVLTDRLREVDLTLKRAHSRAEAQAYTAASAELDSATRQIGIIKALKARADEARTLLERLKLEAEGLSNAPFRSKEPYIGVALVLLDRQIIRIERALKTPGVDIGAVEAALMQAGGRCKYLQLGKLLRAPRPDLATVQLRMHELNSAPGGQKLLDSLVRQQVIKNGEHMLVALAERFRLTGGATDAGGRESRAGPLELGHIYQTLASLDDVYTTGNQYFRRLIRKPAGVSGYSAASGTIVIAAGPEAMEMAADLCNDNELPDVPESCQPEQGADPDELEFSVLHEAGHAVDALRKIMASHPGDMFGGWRNHGVQDVAEVVAAAFGFKGIDANVIGNYLFNGTQPFEVVAGWPLVKDWADRVHCDQKPWDDGERCRKSVKKGGFAVGPRIYHESYKGVWVSYLLAARKRGVRGYQFRSPGEWFADLFAAYKSGALQDTHPDKRWISML